MLVDGQSRIFSGVGRTKKVSKANAAQAALDFITDNTPHMLQPPPMPVAMNLGKAGVKGHYCTILPFRLYQWMKLPGGRYMSGGKVSNVKPPS